MADQYSAVEDLEIIVQKEDQTLLECLLCRDCFFTKEELTKHVANHNTTIEQKYQCKICYKYFSNPQSFKNHKRVHRKRDKLCPKCGKGFYTPNRLKSHLAVVHAEERSHLCQLCPKTFGTEQSLKSHIRNSHRLKQYTCTTCNKKFAKKYALAEHLAAIHLTTKTFHCEICDKMYATKRAIRYHISKTHNNKTYPCPYCDRVLARQISLNVHVQNLHIKPRLHCEACRKFHEVNSQEQTQLCPHIAQHEIKRFECQICLIKFRTRNELKSHNFSVHMEKQHLCDECGQVFDTPEELKSHTDFHQSEKKYQCDICSKRYRGLTALKRHKLNHFEKQFECKVCSRKFTRAYLLRLHMPTHLGEKNLQCSQCPTLFKSHASLRQHELLKHITDANFNCRICKKSFNQLRAYKLHMESCHNLVFKCDICNLKFKLRYKLKNHISQHVLKKETQEDFRLSCAECKVRFRSQKKMEKHMFNHVLVKPFHCEECGKDFRQQIGLKNHLKRHVKKQKHLCDQCGYVCFFEEVLSNHIAKCHSGQNEENQQPESYIPEDEQGDEGNERFLCRQCHREFDSLALLQLHKPTHLYECYQCGQNLRTEKILSDHIKKEHQKKEVKNKYRCELCSASFGRKSLFLKHVTNHKREIKFKKIKQALEIHNKTEEIENKTEEIETRAENQQVRSEVQIGKEKEKKTESKKTSKVVQSCDYERKFKINSYVENKQVTCQKCDIVCLSQWQWKIHRHTYHFEEIGKIKRRSLVKSDQEPGKERPLIISSATNSQAKEDFNINTEDLSTKTSTAKEASSINTDNFSTGTSSAKVVSNINTKDLSTRQVTEASNSTKELPEELHFEDSSVSYKCCICLSSFNRKAQLMAHYEKSHAEYLVSDDRLIQCQRCDRDFTREFEFIQHMTSHKPNLKTLQRCLECLRTFENQVDLYQHRLRHRTEAITSFPCEQCDFMFKTSKDMKLHLIKQHQYWKCKYCDLVYPVQKFPDHVSTHVNDARICKMDVDEMKAAELEEFKENEVSLVKRRKLRELHHCPYCDLSYTVFRTLNLHLVKAHKFVKCKPCGLIFSQTAMDEHEKVTHKDGNKFKCSECDKEFSNFQKMYYHRRKNHMYRCPHCVLMYLPNLDVYKEHLKTFHEVDVAKLVAPPRPPKRKHLEQEDSSDEHLKCNECGKMFQSKTGLRYHIANMFKPKPRWQKCTFRCDLPEKKCTYCKKLFKITSSHFNNELCPEKVKQMNEQRFEPMKKAIEARFKMVIEKKQYQKEMHLLEAKQKMLLKDSLRMNRKNFSLRLGYSLAMGNPKEIKCKKCRGTFYHEDTYKYHSKFTCEGIKIRRFSKHMNSLQELRVIVKRLTLQEIQKHTRSQVPILRIGDGKRRRRPVKCHCCKGLTCDNLVKVNLNKMKQNEDQPKNVEIKEEAGSDVEFDETCSDVSFEHLESQYAAKVETTMESIRKQFAQLNAIIQNNYNTFNKKWAKEGDIFCNLERAIRPKQERTWKFMCHQISTKHVDLSEIDMGNTTCMDYVWMLKNNKPFNLKSVEHMVNVFREFFESWESLVYKFLDEQTKKSSRKEVISIEMQADVNEKLDILITVCNQDTMFFKAFHFYLNNINLEGYVKSITFCNLKQNNAGKTLFQRTLILGEQVSHQTVCGIKVNSEDARFANNLGPWQVVIRTTENYLRPEKEITLLEIGCNNNLIGLALSSKYKQVIGFAESSEIAALEQLRLENGITNVRYEECEHGHFTIEAEKLRNEHLHAIIYVDAKWVIDKQVATLLRKFSYLKKIVLVMSSSNKKLFLQINELILVNKETMHGETYIPINAHIIDKSSEIVGGDQFQLILSLLREDEYDVKPVVKNEEIDTSS